MLNVCISSDEDLNLNSPIITCIVCSYTTILVHCSWFCNLNFDHCRTTAFNNNNNNNLLTKALYIYYLQRNHWGTLLVPQFGGELML